jgi:hydrogenase maturation protease
MRPKITILGLGNLLMGDEGAGLYVIRLLEDELSSKDIQVIDGGTGGLNLLEYFTQPDLLIIVDAALDGQPPGTIVCREPRFSNDYPRTLVAHDFGLKDLLDAADLLDKRPSTVLFTISIEIPRKMQLELSTEIQSAVKETSQRIKDFISSISIKTG